MAGVLKDAPERAGALHTGVIVASIISNIGHSFRQGEFLAGLFILGFSNGIFGRARWNDCAGDGFRARSRARSGSAFSVEGWIAVSPLVRQKAEPGTRSDVIIGFTVATAMLVRAAPASHKPGEAFPLP